MGKGKKSGGRKKKGDDSSSEDETRTTKEEPAVNWKDLDFATRRELQRKEAAEKRRAKLKCHICGKAGHVRRECPGIADDGRGESIHTKSKGDPGAKILSNSSKKSSRNRGRSSSHGSTENNELILPAGFVRDQGDDPFLFFDTSCDCGATIDYLANGRGKKNKKPFKQAVMEYRDALSNSAETSNFGGMISRSILKQGRPWVAPLADFEDSTFTVAFSLGLHRDFLFNDNEQESAASLLSEALDSNNRIVALYSDLDYSDEALSRQGCDRKSQLRRLHCTVQVAANANVPIQIAISPSVSDTENREVAVADLMETLNETIARHESLRVHLCCWSGSSVEMMNFLKVFPENIWVGMDASVGFVKMIHLHEAAFDVPLERLLLETHSPSTIPAVIGQAKGRDAFAYSGLIPYIAECIAKQKPNSLEITSEIVGRATSVNTSILYPRLFATKSTECPEQQNKEEGTTSDHSSC